jgi:hypothetical protein
MKCIFGFENERRKTLCQWRDCSHVISGWIRHAEMLLPTGAEEEYAIFGCINANSTISNNKRSSDRERAKN